LWFLVRDPFQGQLGVIAEAIPVRPLGARTGGLATPEPDICDAVPHQPIEDHGIRPVDEGADPFFPPDEPTLVALPLAAGAQTGSPGGWSCPPGYPTHVPCSGSERSWLGRHTRDWQRDRHDSPASGRY